MSHSPAVQFLSQLVPLGSKGAHETLDLMLRKLSTVELAGLAYDWGHWWGRPEQLAPVAGEFDSAGALTGRNFGKTRMFCEYAVQEAAAGRAMRIGLCAQDEKATVEVLVTGESGLLACSPPWFPARFEGRRVVWPNGAEARLYTAEAPKAIRGHQWHLFLADEIAAWSKATRDEAWSNIDYGLRLGYARLLWSTTPKRRNPLVRHLLARHKRNPTRHRIITGTSAENLFTSPDRIRQWLEDYGGTQKGREEFEGLFLDDSDGALFRQAWIDAARRSLPHDLERRIITVDPAISEKKGADRTGILDMGKGRDGQIYVIANATNKYAPEQWAKLILDMYEHGEADCVVVERNKGGRLVLDLLRAIGAARGLTVVAVDMLAKTHHTRGTVNVKEVYSTRDKGTRAEPASMLYEQGKVSHVIGADLGELEDTLTTWEPESGGQSPDDLDALVHGIFELADLAKPQRAPESPGGMAAVNRGFDREQYDPLRLRGRGGRRL